MARRKIAISKVEMTGAVKASRFAEPIIVSIGDLIRTDKGVMQVQKVIRIPENTDYTGQITLIGEHRYDL